MSESTKVILRKKSVSEMVGLAPSSIDDRIRRGEFPKPIPLGGRAVGWTLLSIKNWIDERIKEGEAQS
ncbi:MAG: helix-turn-helix transcriptional regulator [Paraglaciecola chathamensis]|uniref:helix-turn-helix transcriptional regulator n=1 Tax=Neptunomonas TaxID=75687 RepID=UPI003511E1FD